MTQSSSEESYELLALLPLINRTVVSVTDLKEFGYTKSQLLICSALSRFGNLTMSQLAGYLSSSKEQATRAVAPLVEDGLAERFVDPQNRTRIHVRLTEKGETRMEWYREQIFEKLCLHMRDKLTLEEREELKDSVATMIRLLSKLE